MNRPFHVINAAVLVWTFVLSAVPSTCAVAQSGQRNIALEEIVVTARKRAESLQDVPVAVTAFTLDDIRSAGLRNATDVAALTPGFNMASLFSGDASTPVIRGLSTTIGEPNVGFFVDGVYMGSRQTMTALLGNFVERVEVAKGPQSALYGRNTFGGAVNFVTRRPGEEIEGDVELMVGSDGKQSARATIGGPFEGSNWTYRFAAMYDQFDGFYSNELTGGELDSRESTAALGTLMWQGDSADLAFTLAYDSVDNGDDPLQFIENNNVFVSAFGLPPDNQIHTGQVPDITGGYAVSPGGVDREQLFGALTINWDIGSATLTSITGYTDFDHDRLGDDDYEARELHFVTNLTSVEEFSQEFRFTSGGESRVDWMVGLYAYSRDETTDINSAYQGFLLPIFGGLRTVTGQETDDVAVFGSVGFNLTDALTLTVSGRYGREEKEVLAVDTDLGTSATATFADNGDWSAFLPRVSLDWRINDDHMTYLSYARSEKSGGFNVVTATGAILPQERSYEPESSDNIEIGLKSTFADGRIATNIAAYHIEWTDQIVRALGATNAVLNANAGETTSKGIELEMMAQLSENFSTRIGLAYNDSQYDEYIFGALAGLGLNPDLAGNTLQYTPEWTANISLQYEQPVSEQWAWFGRADWDYLDEQTIVQTADALVGSSNRLNINTGFASERWRFTLWAYNLLENDTATTGVFISNPTIAPDLFVFGNRAGFQVFQGLITGPQLRSYGVTASYSF